MHLLELATLLFIVHFPAVCRAGEVPAELECLCVIGTDVSVRETPCGNVIGQASESLTDCFWMKEWRKTCIISGTSLTFLEVEFQGKSGWIAETSLTTSHESFCRDCTCSYTCTIQAAQVDWYSGGPCGKSSYLDAGELDPLAAPRIVGGRVARPNEFPWQAAIIFRNGTHRSIHPFCGASIMNRYWLLTAAHCVDDILSHANDYRVWVGGHNYTVAFTPGQGELHAISRFVMHRDYCNNTKANDIALIRVSDPMDFSRDDIQPVCEPELSVDYANKRAVVSGWGDTSYNGTVSEVLKYAQLNITDNATCAADIPDIKDCMACATDNTGNNNKDSCQGDSGGPLAVKDNDGTFRLVGVVSFGYKCAAGDPGVYASVPCFLGWIEENMPAADRG